LSEFGHNMGLQSMMKGSSKYPPYLGLMIFPAPDRCQGRGVPSSSLEQATIGRPQARFVNPFLGGPISSVWG
jgi:hypothetical protein